MKDKQTTTTWDDFVSRLSAAVRALRARFNFDTPDSLAAVVVPFDSNSKRPKALAVTYPHTKKANQLPGLPYAEQGFGALITVNARWLAGIKRGERVQQLMLALAHGLAHLHVPPTLTKGGKVQQHGAGLKTALNMLSLTTEKEARNDTCDPSAGYRLTDDEPGQAVAMALFEIADASGLDEAAVVSILPAPQGATVPLLKITPTCSHEGYAMIPATGFSPETHQPDGAAGVRWFPLAKIGCVALVGTDGDPASGKVETFALPQPCGAPYMTADDDKTREKARNWFAAKTRKAAAETEGKATN